MNRISGVGSAVVIAALLAAPLAAFPALAGDRDSVHGTDRDDVLFGDLGHFAGRGIPGDDGLHASLWALDNGKLAEIGRMLEGENGIEGPADTADVIDGGAGNDIIFGQGGNDVIDGGPGSDIVFAGSGNDRIRFDAGDRFIDGGSGIDVLVAAPGAPSLRALKDNGAVRNIEVLLVTDDAAHLDDVPGMSIGNGAVILDATVWKADATGTGRFAARDGSASRLEVGPGVAVVWD